jgi:DNA-binding IclR family transcriptional regulator
LVSPRPRPRRPGGRDFVQSLAKGLEILRAFEQGDLLGNQDLVRRTGLPKATVSRLTGTLESLGYLQLDPVTRKHLLAARWLGLTATAQRHIALRQRLRPTLDAMAEAMDLTAILGARENLSIVFLEMSRPPRSLLTVNTTPGSLVPLASTAIGLAYLVGAPLGERTQLIRDLQQQQTPDEWARTRQTIEQAHADYALRGFVIHQRSRGGAVSGVSTPLQIPPQGHLSVGCAGPSSEMSRRRLIEVVGPRLREEVQRMKSLLARRESPGEYP